MKTLFTITLLGMLAFGQEKPTPEIFTDRQPAAVILHYGLAMDGSDDFRIDCTTTTSPVHDCVIANGKSLDDLVDTLYKVMHAQAAQVCALERENANLREVISDYADATSSKTVRHIECWPTMPGQKPNCYTPGKRPSKPVPAEEPAKTKP